MQKHGSLVGIIASINFVFFHVTCYLLVEKDIVIFLQKKNTKKIYRKKIISFFYMIDVKAQSADLVKNIC